MTVGSTEIMEKSEPQHRFIPLPPHSDQRHSFIAGRFRDALFSALAAKYTANDSHSLPFASDQVKSEIERRLHDCLPSFHTPTHLPYASMIQRAIAELGEEDGLSEDSISDFIVKEYEDLPWAHAAFLRRHLGKLCESGELVRLKCGRYHFKVEDKGVKRKKRQRKAVGSGRRRGGVESRDGIEDFDGKKQSQNPLIIRLRAKEVVRVTHKGTEEQNGSLKEGTVDKMIDEHHEEKIKNKYGPEDFDCKKKSRNVVILGLPAPATINIKGIKERTGSLGKEVRGAEDGDCAQGGQTQVLDKLKEILEVEMIDEHHEEEEVMEEPTEIVSEGSNGAEGHNEEVTLEFFDAISNQGNAEESELIDARCYKKLQEGTEVLEFFDAKSDQGDDEANEMIDARSSKGKVLSKVSDDQTGIGTTEDPEPFKDVSLPSDIIYSPKSPQRVHRVRGRPRKLNLHETMGALSSKVEDKGASRPVTDNGRHPVDQLLPIGRGRGRGRGGRPRKLNLHETMGALSSKVEDKGASRPVTDNGRHPVDQLLPRGRGRGRGRGRPRVVNQDPISMSETPLSSKPLHHQQSPEKKRPGRPPKRKFDADISSKENNSSCSENEQQEWKTSQRKEERKRIII